MTAMAAFQPDPDRIVWRLHLDSPPERVYEMLDTDGGRAAFWAESAEERDGVVAFRFVNGVRYEGRVLERDPPRRWSVDYFGSTVTFALDPDGRGGTDLTLTDEGVPDADRSEVTAGWLNVLFPLKAAVDHRVDLRSHDPTRTWERGYVDQ
jgi:uncharacterized protein YndB with AHSA1/START domain